MIGYYQVKFNLCRDMLSFLYDLPKNRDEKYAYTVIQREYKINEKSIEMLDFGKNKDLIQYYNSLKGDL